MESHIAVWDVIASCEIVGSSDASIKNAVANDLSEILETADIRQIFVKNKAASPQPPLNLQVISNLYKAVRRSRSLCYTHVRFRY